MTATRVAIVGASLGGLRTAEALRSAGYDGEIAVFGDEPWLPYSRPPLSKEALTGELTHAAVAFRRRSSTDDVRWELGVAVQHADLDSRTLALADGRHEHFDALVIATGLRPRQLPLAGPTGHDSGRHLLRTFDDAVALRSGLSHGRRLVVLGAGFIGCEVAASAAELGATVTCVALDQLPMVGGLGPDLAAEIQRRHEQHGTSFRLGTGIERLLGSDRVTGVLLASGEQLACDVVLEAVGSVCNVEWLEGNGLDLSDGVLTDNQLRALDERGQVVEGVVAVGDVARYPNPRFGDEPRRVEHWSNPTDTARRAGPTLAAWLRDAEVDAAPFAPVPSFWSDQFDLRLQAYGMPGLARHHEVLQGELSGNVIVGAFDAPGGVLVGVTSIGMTREVNAYRERVGQSVAAEA